MGTLSLQSDPILPQGYLKVDGVTAATLTTTGLSGVLYKPVTAANGQVLTYNGSSWVAQNVATGGSGTPTGTASGDLGGSYPGPSVTKIQGVAVSSATPTNGQVLTYNGSTSTWVASAGPAVFSSSLNSVLYGTPGIYSFTVPSNVNIIRITLQSASGGGGSSSPTYNYTKGGNGGTGGLTRYTISVAPGATYPNSIVVGASGVGGTNQSSWTGGAGANGGSTSCSIGGITVTVTGGSGGGGSGDVGQGVKPNGSGGNGGSVAAVPAQSNPFFSGVSSVTGGSGVQTTGSILSGIGTLGTYSNTSVGGIGGSAGTPAVIDMPSFVYYSSPSRGGIGAGYGSASQFNLTTPGTNGAVLIEF